MDTGYWILNTLDRLDRLDRLWTKLLQCVDCKIEVNDKTDVKIQ